MGGKKNQIDGFIVDKGTIREMPQVGEPFTPWLIYPTTTYILEIKTMEIDSTFEMHVTKEMYESLDFNKPVRITIENIDSI